MKISAYTVCFNEEELLPFYLRHYGALADRIVVWDNGSTDRSVEMARAFPHPSLEVRHFDSGGELRETRLLDVKNNCWKGDDADWVIVGDVDELLYCPDLRGFLARNGRFDLFRPRGFNMVADRFPADAYRPIIEQVKEGAPNPSYAKVVLFRPDRVREINYLPGCHECRPVGSDLCLYDGERVPNSPLLLCHYKNLGFDYRWRKHEAYRQRLGLDFRMHRWAWQYTLDVDEQRRDFDDLRERAFQILP